MAALNNPQADLANSLPGVFHNWHGIASPAPAGEISFGLETVEVSRWQMELPADTQAANDLLAQSEAQVQSTRQALEETPSRLDRFIAELGSPEFCLCHFHKTQKKGEKNDHGF